MWRQRSGPTAGPLGISAAAATFLLNRMTKRYGDHHHSYASPCTHNSWTLPKAWEEQEGRYLSLTNRVQNDTYLKFRVKTGKSQYSGLPLYQELYDYFFSCPLISEHVHQHPIIQQHMTSWMSSWRQVVRRERSDTIARRDNTCNLSLQAPPPGLVWNRNRNSAILSGGKNPLCRSIFETVRTRSEISSAKASVAPFQRDLVLKDLERQGCHHSTGKS